YWMLRDEHAAEWTRGLDVILQVGETSDMAPAPEDFPKCGSARLVHSLRSDVLFDLPGFADRHAVLRAARDTIPSAQGLPRVCQDSRRPGFHPHIALAFNSHLNGDRPVEESTILQRLSSNRRVDDGLQSFSGIVACAIEVENVNVSPVSLIEADGQLARRRCGFVVLANGAEAALLLRLDVLELRNLLCSQGSEYRDVSHQWWQQVWSSYYPPPLQPPVMSADLISWLISMSIATTCLGCAVSANQVWNIVVESTTGARDMLAMTKCHANTWFKRMITSMVQSYWPPEEPPPIAKKTNAVINDSECSSICDECRSEISSDATNEIRREILPISYGTNWLPKPDFSGYKDAQRKVSMKSLHTVAVVNDVQDSQDDLSPRQLRYKRGCHTVIPSNSSD
ncbi:unnamed protein product, partial [Heterotrigona itama]